MAQEYILQCVTSDLLPIIWEVKEYIVDTSKHNKAGFELPRRLVPLVFKLNVAQHIYCFWMVHTIQLKGLRALSICACDSSPNKGVCVVGFYIRSLCAVSNFLNRRRNIYILETTHNNNK